MLRCCQALVSKRSTLVACTAVNSVATCSAAAVRSPQQYLADCIAIIMKIPWCVLFDRWNNHLDPALSKAPWSEEEDRIIIQTQAIHGNKWAEMSRLLQGRCVQVTQIPNYPIICVATVLCRKGVAFFVVSWQGFQVNCFFVFVAVSCSLGAVALSSC